MMEINLGDIELQNNILKFRYSINYKYIGTISHSFNRFYVVTKFELPKVQNLQFTTIPYDKGCNHLEDANQVGGYSVGMIDEIKQYCIKVVAHIDYYKKQVTIPNRPTVDEISGQLQWNMLDESNRQRQRQNRTSDET